MDEYPMDLHNDAIWDAHVGIMKESASRVTAEPIDVVFTSENYGEELARRLGARHAAFDPERSRVPVSGTEVRADPPAHWDDLAEPVRAGLARRVVIVGAESTGKTTLARALRDELTKRAGPFSATRCVPEFGREVTVEKLAEARSRAAQEGSPPATLEDARWNEADFIRIAGEQNGREEQAARDGGPVLVCDTDAFATGIWAERYLGFRVPAVERIGDVHTHHLYLLTHPSDVAFDQDGLRDGESIRDWMTSRFRERLVETGRPWQWLRGARSERLHRAVAAVEALLLRGWGLAPPLG
jgi:NadR type nicotinamide-nucleotide adenylyltransferase